MPAGRPPVACLAGLLALALALACGQREGREIGPGVLVIVPDGLRADHMGAYGYDRDTSPQLAQLARDGLRFEQVFSSAPRLIPAHIALLTGCEPSVARQFLAPESEGLRERRWLVPPRVPRVAIEFLAAGHATAAFLDHELLAEDFGFRQGFQRFEVLDPFSAEDWEGHQTTRVIEHFLQWLRALPPGKPWFAYVHLNQLERFWSDPAVGAEGYFPPRPALDQVPPVANTDSVFFAVPRSRWRSGLRTLGHYEAAYDDEIRRLDAELGRLFASLRRMGRFDSTSIHVLGSFGVQLGEAGLILTAGRYSRADLGVPWILRPRSGLDEARGRSVPGLVSTLDLVPTLLELEGLAVPSGLHGKSQAEAVRRREAPAAERAHVFASCGLQEGCAAIGEHYALEYLLPLATGDAQLRRSWSGAWEEPSMQQQMYFYDRKKTPYPQFDSEERPGQDAEFAPLRAVVSDWLRDMADVRTFLQADLGRSGLDEATLERLRARGLVEAALPPEGDP